MKQLILYFLFFVGFALILIQCAWLFPSDSKSPVNPTKAKARPQIDNAVNNQNNTAINLAHASNYNFGLKNSLFLPFFYSSTAPRHMVSNNGNSHRRAYSNLLLKRYSFASNYDGKLQQDKKY